MISFPIGVRSNILREGFNILPTDLIQEISRWISRVLGNISSFFSNAASSVTSFFSQLPGKILLGLKRAGIWILLSPVRLISCLWRLSGLGPKLIKAGAYGLKLLKWGAIGTAALVGIVIAGSVGRILYVRYKNNHSRDSFLRDSMFPNYGAIPRSTRPTETTSGGGSRRPRFNHQNNFYFRDQWPDSDHASHADIRGENSQSCHGGTNQGAASGERRRREAEEEARRSKEEERERTRRQERDAEAAAKRRTLESLSNTFAAWKKKTEAIMGDRAKTRSVPQPMSTLCNDSACKERMTALGVTFCAHTMKKLVDAYVEVNKLSVEERRRLLDEQKKSWHPDRFTRCAPDVKETVQRVAQEVMKVMSELMNGGR